MEEKINEKSSNYKIGKIRVEERKIKNQKWMCAIYGKVFPEKRQNIVTPKRSITMLELA